MSGHEASRPVTRIYLHLNHAREQRALIKAPAPGTTFERYRSCLPS